MGSEKEKYNEVQQLNEIIIKLRTQLHTKIQEQDKDNAALTRQYKMQVKNLTLQKEMESQSIEIENLKKMNTELKATIPQNIKIIAEQQTQIEKQKINLTEKLQSQSMEIE